MPTFEMRSQPENVEAALDRFWKYASSSSHEPDYPGFMNWFEAKLRSLKASVQLPIHALSGLPSETQLYLELVEVTKAAGIKITKEGVAPAPPNFTQPSGSVSKLKALNRQNLLLFLLENISPRSREMLLMMAKPPGTEANPSSIISTSSQFDHRESFFRAVIAGDERMAAKMLGRLREEEHDIGELSYLEATDLFHSKHYAESIRYARGVPKDAVDWPRAFMLILESHAFLGDIGAIDAEIELAPGFSFPQFFVPYLCQVAVKNSVDPEASLERAKTIINHVIDINQPLPGTFQMWNRYSCQIAVQYVEEQKDLALRRSAVEQGGRGNPTDETDSFPSLQVRQVQSALILDIDLAPKLSGGEPDEAYKEIVKRLINSGQPDQNDYLQAFVTLWRIGDRSVFVDNVLAKQQLLTALSNQNGWKIIEWAYQGALSLNRKMDAQTLERILRKSPTIDQRLTELVAASTASRLDRQLSPMGKLAFRGANLFLSQAEEASSAWMDAGMISLGFFRILELEFNERLIFPMMTTLDIEGIEKNLATLISRPQNKDIKKRVDFWTRMLESLRRAKAERKGLELGQLEWLLQKIADVSGPDSSLKAIVNSSLSEHLSATGLDALRFGELGKLLDPSKREKFRNPAAHSRYVDLDTARECKRYVEIALERFFTYCADGTVHSSAIH